MPASKATTAGVDAASDWVATRHAVERALHDVGLGSQSSNPLATCVRLPSDSAQRGCILQGMANDRLDSGKRFLMEQRSCIDVGQPRWTEDCHENAHGDTLFVRFDSTHFEGATSVRAVYEALVFFLRNAEISISEKLGHITVREDYDLRGPTTSHHRLLSTDSHGVTQEIHRIMFARFEDHDTVGEESGMVMVDFVDDDELYPYCPSVFVRQDVTAAMLITKHHRTAGSGRGDSDVIVMQRAAFIKIHRPQTDLAPPVLRDLRYDIARWGEAMIQTMADRLDCHAR